MPPPTTLFSFYTSLLKSLLTLVFARLYTPQHIPPRNLTAQTAIITGGNSGIGLSLAVTLAKHGATVYLACRSATRGAAAVDTVVSLAGPKAAGRVFCRVLDVRDGASVRAFCAKWEGRIDVLVHNAGIAAVPAGSPVVSEGGLGVVYGTNFLGGFLMTGLLEGRLSSDARVVFTSSTGSYAAAKEFLGEGEGVKEGVVGRAVGRVRAWVGGEDEAGAYARSKAQQVLFAALLQERFDAADAAGGTNARRCTAHAFTPGFTSTPIFGKFDVSWRTWFSNPLFAVLKVTEKWIAVDTDEGAKTGAWLAIWGDELGKRGEAGGFWERMQQRTSFVGLMKDERKRREWAIWEEDAGMTWEKL